MSYSEDFKIFVATIYGEAGGSSEISWRVVAHSIKNRIGFFHWAQRSNTTQVIAYTGYDAYGRNTSEYRIAKSALDSEIITSARLKRMIELVEPIFYGREDDFTDGVVFYYSPHAQKDGHAKNSKTYSSVVPDWVTKERVHQVFIKGTENDDFAWYKILRTKLFLTFVDQMAKPLEGQKVDIVFADQKKVPLLSGLDIDSYGRVKPFYIADNLGARFKINNVLIKDSKSKEIKIVGDGNNYSAVIVVNDGKGGIKSKTEIHSQQANVPQQKQENSIESSSKEESKDKAVQNSKKIDINFNIKIIDNDNKPIPNMAYFLKYKDNEKKHTVGADGVERNIVAESGQTLSVEISGKDSRQSIKTFIATHGVTEQIVRLELYRFEILFRHKKSGQAIRHLNLLQSYRGRQTDKQTNEEGKISVNAMPGFDLNYKLRDGRNLLTIKVDKNKELRIIDVDSEAIEQAAKNLNEGIQLPKSGSQEDKTENSVPKQAVKSNDQTPQRDKTNTTSREGHPKTIVNDYGEAEFTVLTYDEKTNQLFSGGSYTIEYKGNKRIHVSGTHGLGKKVHKGTVNELIKISIHISGKEQTVFNGKIEKGMKTVELKVQRIEVADVSGVQVLFSGINEEWRRNLVSEKTKKVLAHLAKEAGMDKIYITSSIRTPEAQAQAMYNQNIKYARPGEMVKAVRDACKAQNMSKEQTIKKMVEKIIELQEKNLVVSRHCVSKSSYNKRNVIDIGLNTNGFGRNSGLNTLGKKFKQVCIEAKEKGVISGFIAGDTPGEGAMHIEINQ